MIKNNFFSTLSKLTCCIVFLLVFACENDLEPTNTATSKTNAAVKADVKTENGYLVFNDAEQFNETLNTIGQLSESDKDVWEQKVGFISKRSLIHKAFTELENANDSNIEIVKKSVKDYVLFDDNGNIIGAAFPLYQRAALVNGEGLVRIGNNLLIFKNDRVITIVGADLKKVAQAELLTESTRDGSILVSKIKTTSLGSIEGRPANTSANVTLCYNQNYPAGTLPRYYRSDLVLSSFYAGPSPVQGYVMEDYEVNFKTFSIRFNAGGQYPLTANLDVTVSASFYYDAKNSSIGTVSKNYPSTRTVVSAYTTTNTMFTGNAFVPSGGSFTPKVTTTYATSASLSSTNVLTCNGTNQVTQF